MAVSVAKFDFAKKGGKSESKKIHAFGFVIVAKKPCKKSAALSRAENLTSQSVIGVCQIVKAV